MEEIRNRYYKGEGTSYISGLPLPVTVLGPEDNTCVMEKHFIDCEFHPECGESYFESCEFTGCTGLHYLTIMNNCIKHGGIA